LSAEIRTLAVVGAGQMGTGIAQVGAQAGLSVQLADATGDLAEKGRQRIVKGLAGQVEKGRMAADERDAVLGRIQVAVTVRELSRPDFVVEAVSEDLHLKQRVFRDLDEVCPPHAVLASNTSSISITRLAAATRRPDRVVGMHFMNPVPVMKLVELIRGLSTSDETFETTRALATRMGKTCIASRDVPGFIVNRILMPLVNEAAFALHEGIGAAEDIDQGARLGLNHPMGPLQLADLIGLDTCLAICEMLHRELGDDKYRPCPLLRQYVAAGWLGRKTGRGFYRYEQH
jgi:3-hydroxybutyryl-CoA dehydrogenase